MNPNNKPRKREGVNLRPKQSHPKILLSSNILSNNSNNIRPRSNNCSSNSNSNNSSQHNNKCCLISIWAPSTRCCSNNRWCWEEYPLISQILAITRRTTNRWCISHNSNTTRALCWAQRIQKQWKAMVNNYISFYIVIFSLCLTGICRHHKWWRRRARQPINGSILPTAVKSVWPGDWIKWWLCSGPIIGRDKWKTRS